MTPALSVLQWWRLCGLIRLLAPVPCRYPRRGRILAQVGGRRWKVCCSQSTGSAGTGFPGGPYYTQCAGEYCWYSCGCRNVAGVRKNQELRQNVLP